MVVLPGHCRTLWATFKSAVGSVKAVGGGFYWWRGEF